MFHLRNLAGVLLVVLTLFMGVGRVHANAVSFGIDVNGTVTPVTSGFQYDYTIDFKELLPTGEPVIQPALPAPNVVGLTLPFFDPEAVALNGPISDPIGWSHEFVPATSGNWPFPSPSSPFRNPPYVLHWFSDSIAPGSEVGIDQITPPSITGFSFTSPYGPLDGPVIVSVLGLSNASLLDPPLPASPNSPAVPEPLTASLGALALAALGLRLTRRQA